MTKIFIFTILTLTPLFQVDSREITPNSEQMSSLKEGRIFSHSNVNDMENGKVQSFDLFTQGLHEKNCRYAMRKLSLYENYKDFLSFVEESTYKDGRISLLLDHTLLPFSMRLTFIIPRIKKEGTYPFQFDAGFLKGLEGTVDLIKLKKENRCLFTVRANWKGPHSGIPRLVFELFSSTLTELGMKHLFRISRSY